MRNLQIPQANLRILSMWPTTGKDSHVLLVSCRKKRGFRRTLFTDSVSHELVGGGDFTGLCA